MCSAVSKYLGHFSRGPVLSFHISALPVIAHALEHRYRPGDGGTVALTTANDVFLTQFNVVSKIFRAGP